MLPQQIAKEQLEPIAEQELPSRWSAYSSDGESPQAPRPPAPSPSKAAWFSPKGLLKSFMTSRVKASLQTDAAATTPPSPVPRTFDNIAPSQPAHEHRSLPRSFLQRRTTLRSSVSGTDKADEDNSLGRGPAKSPEISPDLAARRSSLPRSFLPKRLSFSKKRISVNTAAPWSLTEEPSTVLLGPASPKAKGAGTHQSGFPILDFIEDAFFVKVHPYSAEQVPYPLAYSNSEREAEELAVTSVLRATPTSNGIRSPSFYEWQEPPECVLDVGCGHGDWLRVAAGTWKDTHFEGVDLMDFDRDHIPESLLARMKFTRANILQRLPYGSFCFNYIRVAGMGLAVPTLKWASVLSELVHLLKFGGIIEVVEDSWAHPNHIINPTRDYVANAKGLEGVFLGLLHDRGFWVESQWDTIVKNLEACPDVERVSKCYERHLIDLTNVQETRETWKWHQTVKAAIPAIRCMPGAPSLEEMATLISDFDNDLPNHLWTRPGLRVAIYRRKW